MFTPGQAFGMPQIYPVLQILIYSGGKIPPLIAFLCFIAHKEGSGIFLNEKDGNMTRLKLGSKTEQGHMHMH